MRSREIISQIIQWIFAALISFVCCNLIMFFYEAPAGWIERSNAATSAVWNPGSIVVHGTEGYGIYRVDSHGYLNPDQAQLAGGYSLVVGASYTQGREVMPGNRYVDILNNKFCVNDSIMFYTVSKDAFWFPDMIKRFKAITSEFPNSANIILETRQTTFSEEEWIDALAQIDFSENETGNNIVKHLSLKSRVVIFVKEKFPLLSVLKNQMCLILEENNYEQKSDMRPYTQDQLKIVQDALNLLRQQYEGNIYILYHPLVTINQDGSLHIEEEATSNQFRNICNKYGIIFIDSTDAFSYAYRELYIVPYGFNNTSIGTGHFNKDGHKIIADVLYDALKGGDI